MWEKISSWSQVARSRKGKSMAVIIVLGLAAVVTWAAQYWDEYRHRIMRQKIEHALKQRTGGFYMVQYDQLTLDEAGGNLQIKNFSLKPDERVMKQEEASGQLPSLIVEITIPHLSVTGVKTPRALLKKEIVGKKILFKNPLIRIFYSGQGPDSLKNLPTRNVYKQVLGELKSIQAGTIEVEGGRIITQHLKTGEEGLVMHDVFIRLTEVAIDSTSAMDSSRLSFAKEVQVGCGRINWKTMDGFYDLALDSILIHSSSRTASARRFRIEPRLSERAFVKKKRWQDDRFDFNFHEVRMEGLDMEALFRESIVAENMVIGSSSFRIYRDKGKPRDRKNRTGFYPHQVFRKLPVEVSVRKLELQNSFVEYKERNPVTGLSGKVQFHQVQAVIHHLDNSREENRQEVVMMADISTRFMNLAPFRVRWRFYMSDTRGRFDVEGKLGSLPFAGVNPITVPLGPARMKEGTVDALQFSLTGYDHEMSGRVKMLYHDLKVTILEKDKGEKKLDKKTVASLAANVIIKNANPSDKDEAPREVTVEMVRDPNRSIFWLTWKTLFKGIRETAGIKK